MGRNIKEFFTINTILILVLVLLAVISFSPQGATSVFSRNSSALYKIETDEKVVALMCNVYWGTEFIKPYLELFNKEDIKITFFLGGIWVKDNADLVDLMYCNGHGIGNHGYNHQLPSRISKDEVKREITTCDDLVTKITGKKPTLYAPPSGDYNKDTLNIAASLGYSTIMWSIDTIDWRDKDTEKIKSRILDNIKPGSLVLMHPTECTLEALKAVIPELKEMGYKFLTVEQIMTLQ